MFNTETLPAKSTIQPKGSLLDKIMEERTAQKQPGSFPAFGKAPIRTEKRQEKSAASNLPERNLNVEEMIRESAKKTAMPAGFITSSGNVYAYVNSVATIRFTIDSGDNFGELTDRRVCVFIRQEDAAEHDATSLNEYNICYQVFENGETKFKNISEPSQLPYGEELKLVKKEANNQYKIIAASFIPEKGMIPVEKWNNTDITGTHTYIGQKVASLIPTRSSVVCRMKQTGAKCGKPEVYFSQLEKMVRN